MVNNCKHDHKSETSNILECFKVYLQILNFGIFNTEEL